MWRIWIDTGGTFTDGIAVDADGHVHRAKILSTSALRGRVIRQPSADQIQIEESWDAPAGLVRGFRFRLLDQKEAAATVVDYDPTSGLLRLAPALDLQLTEGTAFEITSDEEAPLLAARLLTQTASATALPPSRMRLATTLGTNALLQRRGVPTALFITEGLGDLLRIGTQQRPQLFRPDVQRAAPLYDAVVEVAERLDARGGVLRPLDATAIEAEARALVARGVRTATATPRTSWRCETCCWRGDSSTSPVPLNWLRGSSWFPVRRRRSSMPTCLSSSGPTSNASARESKVEVFWR